jgi:hypothetical protein
VTLARALMRRTDKGKHYGIVTAKFVAVLEALLWGFHNGDSGRCFPSYEAIAERAGCTRTTGRRFPSYEALGFVPFRDAPKQGSAVLRHDLS